MKRLWIAAGLLLVLLTGTLVNAHHAQNLSEQLIDRLELAQQLARQGQWDQAETLTRQSFEQWEDSHFYLHTIMRHFDTDAILRAFQAVMEYLALQEMDQYAAANIDLISQIYLLAEMEQASLVNVL